MTKRITKLLALLLIAAFAVTAFCACGKQDSASGTETGTISVSDTADTGATDTLPEGTKSVTVDVVNKDGQTVTFHLSTEAETLRAALEEQNLIQGDESTYGLYVKTVNGETADYDTDKAYWAFYRSGEMLMTGVDSTMIADGDHYEIVYTK